MPLPALQVPSSAKGGIVTIGNFDGVHLGHQSMLADVSRIAAQAAVPAVAVTLDPHPVELLRPGFALPRLSTVAVRTELLRRYGVDEVVVLPVDMSLLSMGAEQFFAEIVCGQLAAFGLVEGPDFRFGRDRQGNIEVLRHLCSRSGVDLTIIAPVRSDAEMISSTRIRGLLESGRLNDAVALLGHAYTLSGTVTTGAGRGRQIGFPTANLEGVEVLLPTHGVYAGGCRYDGRDYPVAVSIGPNPTFDDMSQKVECHLIDFSGDLYGQSLNIDLLRKIRNLQTFDSTAALIAEIRSDIASCRSVVSAGQNL